jgi:ferric-dicitrate binding protein FerR (iron transport regulator)
LGGSFSLRREQVDEVGRWLGNYHKLTEALEDICELNHALLRPDGAAPRRARARSGPPGREALERWLSCLAEASRMLFPLWRLRDLKWPRSRVEIRTDAAVE